MADLFAPEWSGEPFRLFSWQHLTMLAVVLLVTVGSVLVGSRLSEERRRVVRLVLAAVMTLNIVGWHLWNAAVGLWTPQTLLPLHLCSVLGIVTVAALLTRSPTLTNLSWLLGVGGALQALLTPEVAPFGFPHYRVWQSALAHGLLVVAPSWLVFVEQIRPTLGWVLRCLGILHVYALVVYVVNVFVGSNYLYVNGKPGFATVLNLLPPWPTYLLVLEVILVCIMLLAWLGGRRWRERESAATWSGQPVAG
ncbi:TIGR02206 family membrane protein [Tessaracoccus sp. OS52]|uniref:YwaF family protein n=1 Tax=Tessaracoccus sp. OS52 TaxID=2886691 RepID=UPI001D128E95|nr:TIGR02206 family membrane protein [Tessaracoccus sp. OS52]MCC2593923.1 TIGR02206 family membrane protein [Tessaracoccus sp. OS52]